jgi:molybdate transport system ATP-binding protein
MNAFTFDARLRYDSGFQLDARFTADGGVTALVGPSGAGKTTILSLIAGALRPDEGTLRLGDRTLVDTKAGVFLPPERRCVGMVFQDQLLFPHMTVRKNLLFGKGRPRARAIDFNRVVEMLEMVELLDRLPGSLSGGQKQRVALGRALLRGPELLLMDEPLAALDLELKGCILTYLERAVAEWCVPTLLVSHDRADVRRLASRVVLIAGGRVVAEGPAANVLDGL